MSLHPIDLRKLGAALAPFALFVLAYAAMGLVNDLGFAPRVLHDCDLRALELRWFGAGSETLQDWFLVHHAPILDAACALTYAVFLLVPVGFAASLYARDPTAMKRFAWAFLALNLCGFVTFRLYPAAPPWYFHAHGCAIDPSAHASEGPALARVDAWLPFPYFARFYARSKVVFGAVPSLHSGYALLVLLNAWPLVRSGGRAAFALFFAATAFSAVYLDHHYVIDVLLGVAYAIAVDRAVLVASAVYARRARVVTSRPTSPEPSGP